ncbi:protein delta homolog 2 [Labrus mixtus]|uniref:protein delta homolog 2 n=1 Tax=Labrus mixtus TaxID=508554 RepID=UPI0029BFDD1F|nr:protein delta homolog 2 [Labrus mixtus]XP_060896815.1 protein delta homolog 2 [Labrus mixtus]
MSSARAAAVLLLLSCCLLIALLVPPCTGQGSDCSCNVTNSRCDETGVCRCDPGWDGQHCDRCVPMPGCLHGSCQQPWQCSCEPGWGGRFCDKDLFVCSQQQPCQNGATCVMEDSGEYTCLCPEGFHGRDCHLKTGPCHQRRSPCKNGGLCEDADGFAEKLTCRCLAGFTGARCEIDVDDCLMKPCANGATCLDGVNRFLCLCPAGLTGRFCTVNLDDCASRPCLNDGRCLDLAGGFHCICKSGYTGTTCETVLIRHNNQEPGWTTVGWEGGGGGGVRPQLTTGGRNQRSSITNSNDSNPQGDRLLKVTVSERSAAGLSEVQLIILLVLAGMTLGVVVLTATLVLQGHCRDCSHALCQCLTLSSSTSSSQQGGKTRCRQTGQDEHECQISFLNVSEQEKKKLNTEVV